MKAVVVVITFFIVAGCVAMPDTSLNNKSPLSAPDNTRVCTVDADCVKAECCHARTAVNIQYAPKCEVACSMECVPGTLDCGQGTIKCVNNQCTVIIYPASE